MCCEFHGTGVAVNTAAVKTVFMVPVVVILGSIGRLVLHTPC